MSKRIFTALTLMLFSGFLLTSCKKEKPNLVPTTTEYLAGKWRVTHFAYDDNRNKMLDEQEKESAGYDDELSIFFSTNGTGYTTWYDYYDSSTETDNFTWKLENDDKNIRMIMDYEYGSDTTYMKIYELNLDNCILESNESYGYGPDYTEWVIMQKQKQ